MLMGLLNPSGVCSSNQCYAFNHCKFILSSDVGNMTQFMAVLVITYFCNLDAARWLKGMHGAMTIKKKFLIAYVIVELSER